MKVSSLLVLVVGKPPTGLNTFALVSLKCLAERVLFQFKLLWLPLVIIGSQPNEVMNPQILVLQGDPEVSFIPS